jgi:hypothetical protein
LSFRLEASKLILSEVVTCIEKSRKNMLKIEKGSKQALRRGVEDYDVEDVNFINDNDDEAASNHNKFYSSSQIMKELARSSADRHKERHDNDDRDDDDDYSEVDDKHPMEGDHDHQHEYPFKQHGNVVENELINRAQQKHQQQQQMKQKHQSHHHVSGRDMGSNEEMKSSSHPVLGHPSGTSSSSTSHGIASLFFNYQQPQHQLPSSSSAINHEINLPSDVNYRPFSRSPDQEEEEEIIDDGERQQQQQQQQSHHPKENHFNEFFTKSLQQRNADIEVKEQHHQEQQQQHNAFFQSPVPSYMRNDELLNTGSHEQEDVPTSKKVPRNRRQSKYTHDVNNYSISFDAEDILSRIQTIDRSLQKNEKLNPQLHQPFRPSSSSSAVAAASSTAYPPVGYGERPENPSSSYAPKPFELPASSPNHRYSDHNLQTKDELQKESLKAITKQYAESIHQDRYHNLYHQHRTENSGSITRLCILEGPLAKVRSYGLLGFFLSSFLFYWLGL